MHLSAEPVKATPRNLAKGMLSRAVLPYDGFALHRVKQAANDRCLAFEGWPGRGTSSAKEMIAAPRIGLGGE
jgi:hypothetical protein